MKILINKIVKGKTAVFIDAANLELSAKDLNWRVDYRKLINWLRNESNLVYIGFYTVRFANKAHDSFLTVLKKAGYQLITKPLKLIRSRRSNSHIRKANFDVEIAVETMKRINTFNTFILFSGDSDFHYLIKELKKLGKRIVVVSLKHHISKELIEAADYYLSLNKIRDKIERKR